MHSTQRKAELAHKTINNQLTVLGNLFNVAKEWRKVASVPRIGFLPTAEPEFDFLDFEEATRLVEAAEPDFHPMILLGLRTGLRQGELLEVRWTDVDLVKGLLRVRSGDRSGKERSRPRRAARAATCRSPTRRARRSGRFLHVSPEGSSFPGRAGAT
jgi:integrase